VRWGWQHYILAALAIAAPLVYVFWSSTASAGEIDLRHICNSQGFVDADPDALARAAGVSLNVYALASMMASEAGGENEISQIAVAHTAVNHARERGESVAKLLLRMGQNTTVGDSKSFVPGPGHKHFGKAAHRYATKARPPDEQQLVNAAEVLSGTVEDPTNGAVKFDTPDASLEDVEAVASNRRAAGLEEVTVDGVDAFRFWRAA
jgi:hypothetical protein